jgi:anti-sigma-K factor RskA
MSDSEKHIDFEALCAGYVMDALSDGERKAFEHMLENASPEQRQVYADMLAVKDELALTASPLSPPDELENSILNSLPAKTKDEPKSDSAKIYGISPAVYKVAAAILLIVTLSLSYVSYQLSDTVSSQENRLSELTNQLEKQEQLLDILSAREITFVNMNGLDPSPEGYGKIIWDSQRGRAVLQLANLPAPPADRDYQLWLIKDDGNPISAGVFNFNQSSEDLFFTVDQLNESPSELSNTFAVTLEPKGGVPQPTGEMFLAGVQD